MTEIHVLTVKEPYATALVTGAITTLVHKLKLEGKTCLVLVAGDRDLTDKEAAAYFGKVSDLPLTTSYYKALAEGTDPSNEIEKGIESDDPSEDQTLTSLLIGTHTEGARPLQGNIIGLVEFEESEPISSRFKNYTGSFQLFPEEKWRMGKGNVNLVPWTEDHFWE